jgi:hypothetical protein
MMERTFVELFDCSIRPDRLTGSSSVAFHLFGGVYLLVRESLSIITIVAPSNRSLEEAAKGIEAVILSRRSKGEEYSGPGGGVRSMRLFFTLFFLHLGFFSILSILAKRAIHICLVHSTYFWRRKAAESRIGRAEY